MPNVFAAFAADKKTNTVEKWKHTLTKKNNPK